VWGSSDCPITLAMMGPVADGDSTVINRAEGPSGDVMPTTGRARCDTQLRSDYVNFGTPSRAVFIWREHVNVGVDRCRYVSVGFQVVRQGVEPCD